MQHDRTLAAHTLLRAILETKKHRTLPPPTKRSEREESSPFTLRDGLFQEPKTQPGFARLCGLNRS